jgi:hypothetical protein
MQLHSSSHALARWPSRTAVAALSTCALLTATVSGVADAAPDATVADDCPAPYPVADVTAGLPVSGLTVSHGTQPDEFTGEIVGKIQDGIAPGVDMIIARLSGSEITDPDTGDIWRGIWAGMSGSPVYGPDGRLIGAVSYGLSFSPSDYAGITPAAEMYRVRDYESSGSKGTRAVEVPAGIARRMAADGVSARAVDSGYHRLPMPRTISGLPDARMHRVAERAKYSGREGLASGFGATAEEDPIPIEVGGNLVASQSYGDITSAGTGTATAICDGDVLGFGHPFASQGRSGYSMHGADALYIETDVFDGSYKISNPGSPVGQITQDRLAAILGVEGLTPPSTMVSSHVTATNGSQRDGSTTITEEIYPDDIPYLTVNHLLVNEDRVFDAYAEGTATLRWTVDLERADGTPFQYTRKDMYANASDITYATIWDLYSQLRRVVSNRFADVQVTDVTLTASLDEVYRAFALGTVQRFKDGRWTTLKPGGTIKAASGGVLRLRAWLAPRPGSASVGKWVSFKVPVGRYQAGRTGELTVSGGGSTSAAGPKPQSLAQLLSALGAAPTNNSVWGRLQVGTPDGKRLGQGHVATPTVVSGSTSVTVKITR